MKTPADAVKHKANTARTPKIPSALEGWPFVVALAGLPFELPDAADVWLSPPAEEVLEFVDAEAVLPPIPLVPAAEPLSDDEPELPPGEVPSGQILVELFGS